MSSILIYASLLVATPAAESSAKPNVIVFFSDDHGWADLGCQGIEADLKTPHIDALAASGVRFTDGYVTAPQCVPSRGGLISGRYQSRFGLESNQDSLDGFNAQVTLPERLRDAGYVTGMAGKWHLGEPSQITSHGFDFVYYKNANRPGWANFALNGQDRTPGPEKERGYHIDVCSNTLKAFIDRHYEQPFFFYCAYRAPHVPLDPPEKYLARFPGDMPERRRKALAMIAAMDDGVGKTVATLREHNLEEKTLIFYIGDNGAPLKIHKIDAPGGGAGWDGSLNAPMNGEKGMLAEGGIRVPFVAAWKGTIPSGQTFTEPVISLDVAATACALAGVETSDDDLDGVDLLPYLTGENSGTPHDALYWRWIAQAAVREGDWKLLRGGDREYLFNIRDDPSETANLLASMPDKVEHLRGKLAAWTDELQPPGVTSRPMSTVWENYFDHYLDGKTIPMPKNATKPKRKKKSR